MSASASVLGVLGRCWVGFIKPTRMQPPESVACGQPVLGVLGSRTRARIRSLSSTEITEGKNLHASPEKPNTPNTLHTGISNPLNSLSFECVGSVLGWPNVCWVLDLEVKR